MRVVYQVEHILFTSIISIRQILLQPHCHLSVFPVTPISIRYQRNLCFCKFQRMTSIKFFLAPTAFTYTLSCCNQHWKFLFSLFYRLGSIYVKSLKIFSIVRLLYCIYQWSPHHTDLSFICSYFWILPSQSVALKQTELHTFRSFHRLCRHIHLFLVKLLPSLAENFIILRIFWDTNCKLYAFLHAGNVDFELIFPREVSLQMTGEPSVLPL